ncbi:unnamed protein product [Porites lobata]|uniref:Uncharacterized protein n=1 Tax=Porites lobata TaxID=104759 RepID=A0ABN8N003_9CNID|nr:unnamed protein product [Porites lobata]
MALYGPLTQFSAVQLNSVVLFSFLLAFIADPSDVDSHGHTAMFYSVKEASLIGNVTVVKQTTSDVECAFLCLRMYPGSCFSFNFGRTVTLTKLHDCELSNSEGALKPHKMYSRRGFDYFGMESVYLARYFPCLSSPCQNGGSCVNGPALKEFSCTCPLKIQAMPYIDNKCNINRSLITTEAHFHSLFHAKVGRYKLNYFEAERLCEILGASLASWGQLTVAWQGGLQLCQKGWLNGAIVAYPMREVKGNCGNKTGIVEIDYERNRTEKPFNAWCYKP